MDRVGANREAKVEQKPSLRGEILKGWHWAVFVWGMLRRIGGPVAILRTFWTILSMMAKRTLAQWGIGR
jgi:hypothetical protein